MLLIKKHYIKQIVFRAFGFGNNENQLDYFFTLFFKHYLLEYSQKSYCDSHLMEVLPSVHWLPLPVDIKVK